MDFIFVSIQPIDAERNSTSVSIARELAKTHRVLFVNPPVQRREYWFGATDVHRQGRVKKKHSGKTELQSLSPNLWMLDTGCIMESINWLPSTYLVKCLTLVNNRRMAQAIDQALKQLDFRNYIIVNDKDIFRSFYLKELLSPHKYIYLDRDYTLGVPYWKRHGRHMEPALLRKSDMVVCNSPAFAERARMINPNSFYIGNGFDDTNFDATRVYPEPDDIKNIPHPRMIYLGAMVSTRLDKDLMLHLAKAKPGWNLILLGWEDDLFKKSDLHKLSNVHFLCKKKLGQVPQYLSHCDVAINPQLLNTITSGNFPLKIVEYLAMGLPVVATATQTMVDIFSSYAYLASSPDAFVKQVERSLEENDEERKQARMDFAEQFTWKNVTRNFLEVINPGNQAVRKEPLSVTINKS